MSKTIITFLFTLIITASIVAPNCINLSESTIEITEIVDFGEEEEKGKESIKDLEVKIYYSIDKEGVFLSLEHKKRIRYCSKNYTFKFTKLNSPPPEEFFA